MWAVEVEGEGDGTCVLCWTLVPTMGLIWSSRSSAVAIVELR